jgi:hypothetical protein
MSAREDSVDGGDAIFMVVLAKKDKRRGVSSFARLA